MQPQLFDVESQAAQRFREFDEKNPRVYEELVELTKEAYQHGRRKIGIKMMIEVIRWNRFIQTTGDTFKVNNNFAPRYARKIMAQYPEYDGIFELRGMKE